VKEETERGWVVSRRVKEGLERLPAKYLKVSESVATNVVGLELPLGVEKDVVIDSLIDQVKEISAICSGSP